MARRGGHGVLRRFPGPTLVAGALSLAVSLGAMAADAGPVVVAVGRATPIAGLGDRLVWSELDPASRRYRLMTRVGGTTSELPVPTRGVPFDVDLGRTPGGVVAVYSRCRDEPPASDVEIADYAHGKGCDLYRFDFASRTETRMRAQSSGTASEAWPTISGRRVAFARADDAQPERVNVYVDDLTDAAPPVRLVGGPRRTCRGGVCSRPGGSGPFAIELSGRRLAYGWHHPGLAEAPAYELLVADVTVPRRAPRALDRVGGGGLTEIVLGWPAFERRTVYWSRQCIGDVSGCPHRRALARARVDGTGARQVVERVTGVQAHERAGGTTYVMRRTDGGDGPGCGEPEPATTGECRIERLARPYGAPAPVVP